MQEWWSRRRGDVEREIEGHRYFEGAMGKNTREIISLGKRERSPERDGEGIKNR